MSAPYNLTQSHGQESILAVDSDRILLLLKHDDQAQRVISYEFDQAGSRADGLFGRFVETVVPGSATGGLRPRCEVSSLCRAQHA